jgi:hypothetical protein
MEKLEKKIEKEATAMAIAHIQSHPPFYGQIPQTLLRDDRISHLAKLIFGAMHSRAPEKELKNNIAVEIAKETLANDLGVSEERIRIGINELIEAGWIKKHRQVKKLSNMYVLYPMKKQTFKDIKAMKRVHLRINYDYDLARRLKKSLYE